MTTTPSRTRRAPRKPLSPELAGLIVDRVAGRSLQAPFYTSPEVFDLDIVEVFAKHWLFAATDAEIPEPGDYVTLEIGPYSVILVRDDDERVSALHNVCRHRGARILNDACGSVGNLVCGYHHWTYSTDGSLLHADSQPADFDRSPLGLRKVAVRSVAGLLFICLADEPPADFDDMATRITPYLEPHALTRTKVAAQEDLIEAGNWKLVMENNRECYHCDGHPELSCSLFPTYGYDPAQLPARLLPAHERYLRAEADLHRACAEHGLPFEEFEDLVQPLTAYRIQREPLDGAGESFTPDGSAVSRRLLGDFTEPKLGRLSMHLQPNAWFHVLSDHAVTFSVIPLAADRTLVRTTWLVHEDAVEGQDYDLEELKRVWHQTNKQDGTFVERAQLGVSSPAYEPGPYAPNEYQVEAFCSWYANRLRAGIAADPGVI
ncbi:aromatic ring-hydroxylating oxygenase subunit alpha [Paeniglutamicibacter cryotolerans]|uniref:Rieske 2Fe-2S family protein n=1 Tax=Paeniglutamicibacter cryotolerans TaxID=670079 RepID=A0A839QKS2_9MICC|nr:aromatic ring-hydroxylating dioxygenase subunit alpha [Paeniglutamicibacter cryotolerans]MBB2996420.1 Rieske 2Fe-2S family protein [Paeniglutamicibacter cryotolerans]